MNLNRSYILFVYKYNEKCRYKWSEANSYKKVGYHNGALKKVDSISILKYTDFDSAEYKIQSLENEINLLKDILKNIKVF